MELIDIIHTSASVFIPVFAVFYKIDSDKRKAETQALLEKNRSEIMNAIHQTKDELAEVLISVSKDVVTNTEVNKRQDTQINRSIEDLETIRKKIFNGSNS